MSRTTDSVEPTGPRPAAPDPAVGPADDRAPAQPTVAIRRQYAVLDVRAARAIAAAYLADQQVGARPQFGLPEIDDRYHIWRVPLLAAGGAELGEIVIDAYLAQVDPNRSTRPALIAARQATATSSQPPVRRPRPPRQGPAAAPNGRPAAPADSILAGDAEAILPTLPAESVDLIFTSPPYFNARPDYSEYAGYDDYLAKLHRVIVACHRVLADGRFFVINVSPVLIRRTSRSRSSKRLAVPFDVHALFTSSGYDFIDDIIWQKPAGAGWATGRGRRFAADRQPLQYKPVPVIEYVLVYRKQTDKLIDWHIRHHHDPAAVRASRIADDYERTNVWQIKPAHSPRHPAVFPNELAEKVIRYYSFLGDLVLDPFAGSGTTGAAAARLGRRWLLIEREAPYVADIRRRAETEKWALS